jgi:hypothetical protein
MELYRQRFEDDMTINYRDLWNYIQNKLEHNGESVFKVDEKTAKHAKEINDAAENEELIQLLEAIVLDPITPEQELPQAELLLKLLKLIPL